VDVKPIAGTEWCEAPHFQYQVSGRLHVVMKDGREFDLGPGSVSHLPAGHDAWVLGQEPVVLVDWFGATRYAKRRDGSRLGPGRFTPSPRALPRRGGSSHASPPVGGAGRHRTERGPAGPAGASPGRAGSSAR
jgi:hypothetical protein